MKSIALFGGSFDPPHIGHVSVTVNVLNKLNIDKLIIMPVYLNPFKSKVFAPAKLRKKWLKKIFQKDKRIEVSNFEIKAKKKVPTITTVKYLRHKYNKIYLIIGADNLKDLKKWHKYHELKQLVTFVIVPRDNIKIPKKYIVLHVNKLVSSNALRKEMNINLLPKQVAKAIKKFYKEIN